MPVRHVTLTPGQASTVTVSGDYENVAVLHRNNLFDDVWATVNDTDPVADANDSYVIPAGMRRKFAPPGQTGDARIRLRSAGAVKLEVEFS